MRLMLALGFTIALAGSPAYANFIDSGGRDWLTPDDTRSATWNDYASVCNTSTGACSGTLLLRDGVRSVDLTGYTWATRDEVRDLFYDAAGLPAGSLDSYAADFPTSPQYATQFFNNYGFTFSGGSTGFMPGLSRTLDPSGLGYLGFVSGDNPLSDVNNAPFSTFQFLPVDLDLDVVTFAAYVYRLPPTSVPEPSTLVLFAGLLGLVIYRTMRRQPASANSMKSVHGSKIFGTSR